MYWGLRYGYGDIWRQRRDIRRQRLGAEVLSLSLETYRAYTRSPETYGGRGSAPRGSARYTPRQALPATLALSLDSLSLVGLVGACTWLHSLSLAATASGHSQCLLLVPDSQCLLLVPCHSDSWRRSPPPLPSDTLPSDTLPSPPLPSPTVPADSYCASPLAALLVGVVLVRASEHASSRTSIIAGLEHQSIRACLSSPTPLYPQVVSPLSP